MRANALGSISTSVTPHRLWAGAFVIWLFLLSGVLTQVLGMPPGGLQLLRLNGLLRSKQAQLAEIESQIIGLSSDQVRLEQSQVEQKREIRRVLGYVAKDEIVFEFSSADRPE